MVQVKQNLVLSQGCGVGVCRRGRIVALLRESARERERERERLVSCHQ